MSAVLAFLRLFWKPLLILVAAGAVWFVAIREIHEWGDARYAAGRADERAPWLIAQANAETAARAALQAQIDTANTTDKHNAQTIADLDRTLADAALDRDHLVGLLAAAHQRIAAGHPVHETAGQPSTAEPSGPRSDGRLNGLLADAIRECNGNRAGHGALIEEIRPQL